MYRRRRNNQQPIYRVYTTSAYRSPLNMSVNRYLDGLPHTDYFAPEEAHRVATYISKQMQAARSKNKFVFVVEIMGNSVSFLDFDAGKRLSYQDFQKEYSKSFSSSTQLYKRNPDEDQEAQFAKMSSAKKFDLVQKTFAELDPNTKQEIIDMYGEDVVPTNRDNYTTWWKRLNAEQNAGDQILAELWKDYKLPEPEKKLTLEEQIANIPEDQVDESYVQLYIQAKEECEKKLVECNKRYQQLLASSTLTRENYQKTSAELAKLNRDYERTVKELDDINRTLRILRNECTPLQNKYNELQAAHEELKKKCPVRLGAINVGSVEAGANWDSNILKLNGAQIFDSLRAYACYKDDALNWFIAQQSKPQYLRFAAIKENSTVYFVFEYRDLLTRSFLTLDQFHAKIITKRAVVDDEIHRLEQQKLQEKRTKIDDWLKDHEIIFQPKNTRQWDRRSESWVKPEKSPCRKKFDDFAEKIEVGFQTFRNENSADSQITVENAASFFEKKRETNKALKENIPSSSANLSRRHLFLSEKQMYALYIDQVDVATKWQDLVHNAVPFLYKYTYDTNKSIDKKLVYKPQAQDQNDYAPESMDNTRVFNATPHTMSYFVGEKNPEYDDKQPWIPAFKGYTEEVFMPLSGMAIRKVWAVRKDRNGNVADTKIFWVAIFYTLDSNRGDKKWFHPNLGKNVHGRWGDEEICDIHAWGIIDINKLKDIVPTSHSVGGKKQQIKSFVSDTVNKSMPSGKEYFLVKNLENEIYALTKYAALCFERGCTMPVI